MSSDEGSVGSNEVSEVMSPQVSLEMMGPQMVTDLPRYHSLVEDFGRLADRWMAAGQLRGLVNVGGGYLLVDPKPPPGDRAVGSSISTTFSQVQSDLIIYLQITRNLYKALY